jgi:hypothetical protein
MFLSLGMCKNVYVLKVAVCDYGEEGQYTHTQAHTPRCFVVKMKQRYATSFLYMTINQGELQKCLEGK